MKIIGKSNFDDESVADILVAENVQEHYGKVMVRALNEMFSGSYALYHYCLVPDDYKLWRGMEEFV